MTTSTQPPSQTERRDLADDEISLVDLAKILVRRWKAMAVIFALVLVAALAYALLVPRAYQYVSIYNAAEQAPGEALESPSSLVAKAQSLYLGPLTRELLAEQGWESLPFEVRVSNPADTQLVTFSSEANLDHAGPVEALHHRLLERLQQGQQGLVERRRETLERQLESANEALVAVRASDNRNAGELIATYTSRIADLEADLADLRDGEIGQVAVKSLEPADTSRSLIMALASLLGGMLAVIGVLLIQFASLVCASLKDDRANHDS